MGFEQFGGKFFLVSFLSENFLKSNECLDPKRIEYFNDTKN